MNISHALWIPNSKIGVAVPNLKLKFGLVTLSSSNKGRGQSGPKARRAARKKNTKRQWRWNHKREKEMTWRERRYIIYEASLDTTVYWAEGRSLCCGIHFFFLPPILSLSFFLFLFSAGREKVYPLDTLSRQNGVRMERFAPRVRARI